VAWLKQKNGKPCEKLASTAVFVTSTGELLHSTVDGSQCSQQRSFYQITTKGEGVCVGRRGTCHIQLYTARKQGTCNKPPTCCLFECRLSLDLHYCFEFWYPGFISCLRISLSWLEALQLFHSLYTNAETKPKIRPLPLPSASFPIHYSLIIQP
jgi:hypothetical protein